MGAGGGPAGGSAWGAGLPPAPFDFIVPTTAPNEGGTKITINGTFTNGDYRIHVGPNGDATDPVCFSGVLGQGSTVKIFGGKFTLVLPPLPIGGPYPFFLKNLGDGSELVTSDIITVIPHDFKSQSLDLRRLFPPKWKVGFRRLLDETFPQI